MKDSSPNPPVKENQAAVEKKAAFKSANRKGASAQEKENKGEVATAKPGRGRTRSLKVLNKDISKSEEVPFVKPGLWDKVYWFREDSFTSINSRVKEGGWERR